MADSFSVSSSQSWISRLGQSIVGVLIGIVLFLVSFPLLFWNEGRAVQTAKSLEEGAAAVVSVPADPVDPANDGKLVHLTGEATTTQTLSDATFGVSAQAVKLHRIVEMYQWKEESKSETRKKFGGGEETVTTYSYHTDWSADPIDSSKFKDPDGHRNPPAPAVKGETFTAREVKLGAFDLSPGLVRQMTDEQPLPLTSSAETAPKPDAAVKDYKVGPNEFYKGADPARPQVGDVRVNFREVRPGPVSVIARQVKNTFEPYHAKAGDNIEMLKPGTHSATEMFEAAQSENRQLTWILRLVGFVLMAVGIALVFRPLTVVADVIPFVGDLLGFGVAIFAAVIAFGLSLVTIALGWVFYRPVLGIGLLVVAALVVGGVIFLARKRRRTALTGG